MKALVKYGPGSNGMSVQEVPEPIPQTGEIKIRVIAAGICGTDIHIMSDEYPYNPPVIMGHEYVGVVTELGSGVTGFKVGDNVVSLTAVKTCGSCRYCRDGLLMLCKDRLSIGSGVNGAFAEYLTVPARLAFKVPEEVVTVEEVAACEPLACVVRSVVERASVKAGDIVLVSGPGTIGLMALQLAKVQGGYVIVSGTLQDEKRLELARELGADITVSNPEELLGTIKAINPYGVDVAFECAGAAGSADLCIKSLRKQGLYSQVGLFGKVIPIDMDLFLTKEVLITNSFATEASSWEIALRLLKNNQIKLGSLISAKIPLANWKDAFDMMLQKQGYKILLIP